MVSLKENVKRVREIEENAFIIVAGNKSDLEEQREITIWDIKEFQVESSCPSYVMTSALTGDGVKRVFDEIAKEMIERWPLIKKKWNTVRIKESHVDIDEPHSWCSKC